MGWDLFGPRQLEGTLGVLGGSDFLLGKGPYGRIEEVWLWCRMLESAGTTI